MTRSPIERIKHYNRLLVEQHRFIGGTVLEGYGLRTRVFAWRQGRELYAWGNDYTPAAQTIPWLSKLFFGPGYDDGLGLPGMPTSEAWLSVATPHQGKTDVTQFEYDTGIIRGIDPRVAVAEHTLDIAFDDVDVSLIRGGLGFWRGILPNLPKTTCDPEYISQLADTLQIAAGAMIAQDGTTPDS